MYDVRLAKGRYWRWRSLMSEWYTDLVRDKNISHSRFLFPQVLLVKGHTTPFYIFNCSGRLKSVFNLSQSYLKTQLVVRKCTYGIFRIYLKYLIYNLYDIILLM